MSDCISSLPLAEVYESPDTEGPLELTGKYEERLLQHKKSRLKGICSATAARQQQLKSVPLKALVNNVETEAEHCAGGSTLEVALCPKYKYDNATMEDSTRPVGGFSPGFSCASSPPPSSSCAKSKQPQAEYLFERRLLSESSRFQTKTEPRQYDQVSDSSINSDDRLLRSGGQFAKAEAVADAERSSVSPSCVCSSSDLLLDGIRNGDSAVSVEPCFTTEKLCKPFFIDGNACNTEGAYKSADFSGSIYLSEPDRCRSENVPSERWKNYVCGGKGPDAMLVTRTGYKETGGEATTPSASTGLSLSVKSFSAKCSHYGNDIQQEDIATRPANCPLGSSAYKKNAPTRHLSNRTQNIGQLETYTSHYKDLADSSANTEECDPFGGTLRDFRDHVGDVFAFPEIAASCTKSKVNEAAMRLRPFKVREKDRLEQPNVDSATGDILPTSVGGQNVHFPSGESTPASLSSLLDKCIQNNCYSSVSIPHEFGEENKTSALKEREGLLQAASFSPEHVRHERSNNSELSINAEEISRDKPTDLCENAFQMGQIAAGSSSKWSDFGEMDYAQEESRSLVCTGTSELPQNESFHDRANVSAVFTESSSRPLYKSFLFEGKSNSGLHPESMRKVDRRAPCGSPPHQKANTGSSVMLSSPSSMKETASAPTSCQRIASEAGTFVGILFNDNRQNCDTSEGDETLNEFSHSFVEAALKTQMTNIPVPASLYEQNVISPCDTRDKKESIISRKCMQQETSSVENAKSVALQEDCFSAHLHSKEIKTLQQQDEPPPCFSSLSVSNNRVDRKNDEELADSQTYTYDKYVNRNEQLCDEKRMFHVDDPFDIVWLPKRQKGNNTDTNLSSRRENRKECVEHDSDKLPVQHNDFSLREERSTFLISAWAEEAAAAASLNRKEPSSGKTIMDILHAPSNNCSEYKGDSIEESNKKLDKRQEINEIMSVVKKNNETMGSRGNGSEDDVNEKIKRLLSSFERDVMQHVINISGSTTDGALSNSDCIENDAVNSSSVPSASSNASIKPNMELYGSLNCHYGSCTPVPLIPSRTPEASSYATVVGYSSRKNQTADKKACTEESPAPFCSQKRKGETQINQYELSLECAALDADLSVARCKKYLSSSACTAVSVEDGMKYNDKSSRTENRNVGNEKLEDCRVQKSNSKDYKDVTSQSETSAKPEKLVKNFFYNSIQTVDDTESCDNSRSPWEETCTSLEAQENQNGDTTSTLSIRKTSNRKQIKHHHSPYRYFLQKQSKTGETKNSNGSASNIREEQCSFLCDRKRNERSIMILSAAPMDVSKKNLGKCSVAANNQTGIPKCNLEVHYNHPAPMDRSPVFQYALPLDGSLSAMSKPVRCASPGNDKNAVHTLQNMAAKEKHLLMSVQKPAVEYARPRTVLKNDDARRNFHESDNSNLCSFHDSCTNTLGSEEEKTKLYFADFEKIEDACMANSEFQPGYFSVRLPCLRQKLLNVHEYRHAQYEGESMQLPTCQSDDITSSANIAKRKRRECSTGNNTEALSDRNYGINSNLLTLISRFFTWQKKLENTFDFQTLAEAVAPQASHQSGDQAVSKDPNCNAYAGGKAAEYLSTSKAKDCEANTHEVIGAVTESTNLFVNTHSLASEDGDENFYYKATGAEMNRFIGLCCRQRIRRMVLLLIMCVSLAVFLSLWLIAHLILTNAEGGVTIYKADTNVSANKLRAAYLAGFILSLLFLVFVVLSTAGMTCLFFVPKIRNQFVRLQRTLDSDVRADVLKQCEVFHCLDDCSKKGNLSICGTEIKIPASDASTKQGQNMGQGSTGLNIMRLLLNSLESNPMSFELIAAIDRKIIVCWIIMTILLLALVAFVLSADAFIFPFHRIFGLKDILLDAAVGLYFGIGVVLCLRIISLPDVHTVALIVDARLAQLQCWINSFVDILPFKYSIPFQVYRTGDKSCERKAKKVEVECPSQSFPLNTTDIDGKIKQHIPPQPQNALTNGVPARLTCFNVQLSQQHSQISIEHQEKLKALQKLMGVSQRVLLYLNQQGDERLGLFGGATSSPAHLWLKKYCCSYFPTGKAKKRMHLHDLCIVGFEPQRFCLHIHLCNGSASGTSILCDGGNSITSETCHKFTVNLNENKVNGNNNEDNNNATLMDMNKKMPRGIIAVEDPQKLLCALAQEKKLVHRPDNLLLKKNSISLRTIQLDDQRLLSMSIKTKPQFAYVNIDSVFNTLLCIPKLNMKKLSFCDSDKKKAGEKSTQCQQVRRTFSSSSRDVFRTEAYPFSSPATRHRFSVQKSLEGCRDIHRLKLQAASDITPRVYCEENNNNMGSFPNIPPLCNDLFLKSSSFPCSPSLACDNDRTFTAATEVTAESNPVCRINNRVLTNPCTNYSNKPLNDAARAATLQCEKSSSIAHLSIDDTTDYAAIEIKSNNNSFRVCKKESEENKTTVQSSPKPFFFTHSKHHSFENNRERTDSEILATAICANATKCDANIWYSSSHSPSPFDNSNASKKLKGENEEASRRCTSRYNIMGRSNKRHLGMNGINSNDVDTSRHTEDTTSNDNSVVGDNYNTVNNAFRKDENTDMKSNKSFVQSHNSIIQNDCSKGVKNHLTNGEGRRHNDDDKNQQYFPREKKAAAAPEEEIFLSFMFDSIEDKKCFLNAITN